MASAKRQVLNCLGADLPAGVRALRLQLRRFGRYRNCLGDIARLQRQIDADAGVYRTATLARWARLNPVSSATTLYVPGCRS